MKAQMLFGFKVVSMSDKLSDAQALMKAEIERCTGVHEVRLGGGPLRINCCNCGAPMAATACAYCGTNGSVE